MTVGLFTSHRAAGGFGSWSLSLPTGSTGRKLLCDAQASSNVPSTVKCSSLSSCPGPCFSQNPLKERFGDVSFQHALPVLGKRAGIPHRVIHAQPHKPAEQQVVIQLLHQQPLASH